MKVTLKGKTQFVDWRYDNPQLDQLIQEKGLTQEDVKKMPTRQLLQLLGISKFPDPAMTHCIVRNEDMEIVHDVLVKKHLRDPHSKEKARRFSLQKLLDTYYPGDENKQIRKAYWDAYINRSKQ
jgi:hypothetical protein